MSTVPNYEDLADRLGPADPDLLRALCSAPAWIPPMPQIGGPPLTREELFKVISGLVAAGAPAPIKTEFFPDSRELELQMADGDRAGVQIFCYGFSLSRPSHSTITTPRGTMFGASTSRPALTPDDDAAMVLASFGGWGISVNAWVTL